MRAVTSSRPDRADAREVRRGRRVSTHRRGALLIVVLVIVAVLAILGTSFSFRMQADIASVSAVSDQQQARLAAETGIQRVMLHMRENRVDTDSWWNNPRNFRRQLVWAPDKEGGSQSVADQEAVEGRPAWRFSIVQNEVEGRNTRIRYGIIDEASKLNLNTASREQLIRFFDQVDLENENVTSIQLADALIDWRDEDDIPVSPHGAESSYYMTLNPPYRAKNRFLETVEELLMIKGFNGRIVYGEDYNRNGYLDENEDDGPEGAFPPDNGDGVLNRGLLPFVTVYSWDFNSGNDNKPRVNINQVRFGAAGPGNGPGGAPGGNNNPPGEAPGTGDPNDGQGGAGRGGGAAAMVPEHIFEEIRPEVIEFIAEAQRRGYRFRSVGELLGLEVYEDGSSNYDEMWQEHHEERRRAGQVGMDVDEEAEEELMPDDGLERRDEDARDDDTDRGQERDPFDEEDDEAFDPNDRLDARRQQSIRVGDETDAQEGPGRRQRGERGRPFGRDQQEGEGRPRGRGEQQEGDPAASRGTPVISPVDARDMPVLMDRLTTVAAPAIPGLINVNTASARVLRSIPGLSEEEVSAVVARRAQLNTEEKESTAWLVTRQVVRPETFALISNHLTTRSIQFSIDSIGFADHTGTFKRIQAVIEMRGHIGQIKYYRDISELGIGYPVHDDQRTEGFSFAD